MACRFALEGEGVRPVSSVEGVWICECRIEQDPFFGDGRAVLVATLSGRRRLFGIGSSGARGVFAVSYEAGGQYRAMLGRIVGRESRQRRIHAGSE